MPLFDLPLDQLEDYRHDRPEPDDFAEFWRRTVEETGQYALDPRVETHDLSLPLVEASRVTFAGFGGQPVHALYLRPHRRVVAAPPTVVQFLGYGDGTGSPLDWLALPAAGIATIVMDTRGQGARARRAGRTGDLGGSASPHVEGFVTRGILDPADHYYRRVFADAVRAVEAAAQIAGTDPSRIAVAGTSQGGAIALAAAAWTHPVAGAVVNVPFLCAPARAVELTDRAPYSELIAFMRTHRSEADRALRTLDYVDGVHHAARATVPALFSVALMDPVCPPSTVYAAYNAYGGPKQMQVYPWNEHEGGGSAHDELTVRWLRDIFDA